jgi:Methyltransferase domain
MRDFKRSSRQLACGGFRITGATTAAAGVVVVFLLFCVNSLRTSSQSLTDGLLASSDLFRSTNPTSLLAYKQSLGFFDDIPDHDWKRRQSRARRHKFHSNPGNPLMLRNNPAMWYLNNYDPFFTCSHEVRVGGPGDGPKWVCDPHRLLAKECLVYSFGCAGNYRFEDGLVEELGGPHCEIHVFDPRMDFARPRDQADKRITFHQWGLKSSYDNSLAGWQDGNTPYYTMQEIQAKLGHKGRTINILKADIEFCEWFLYKDWLDPTKADVRQLLIESHSIPGPKAPKSSAAHFPADISITPVDFFEDVIGAGFALFSKEPNTHPAATVRVNPHEKIPMLVWI